MGACKSKLSVIEPESSSEPQNSAAVNKDSSEHSQDTSEPGLNDQLIRAVENNHLLDTLNALKRGATPDCYYVSRKDGLVMTPLNIACLKGDKSMVVGLLKNGADPNFIPDKGYLGLPLACAAHNGDVNIVRVLLKYGAHVNPQDSIKTPLHYSCINLLEDPENEDHARVFKVLINQGAELKSSETTHRILYLCCEYGLELLLETLLRARGDNVASFKVNTSLSLDEMNLEESLSSCRDKKIIDQCVNISIYNSHTSILKILLKYGLNSQDLLAKAIIYDHKQIVEWLVENKYVGSNNAICEAIRYDNEPISKYLLDNYKVNLACKVKPNCYEILFTACDSNKVGLFKTLISEKNASIDIALRAAVKADKINFIHILIKDFSLTPDEAVQAVINKGRSGLLKKLLNSYEVNKDEALEGAVISEKPTIVKLLLEEFGASKDKAIQLSIDFKKFELIDMFIDLNIADKHTISELAIAQKVPQISGYIYDREQNQESVRKVEKAGEVDTGEVNIHELPRGEIQLSGEGKIYSRPFDILTEEGGE
jgi:ankyrin repeat protein